MDFRFLSIWWRLVIQSEKCTEFHELLLKVKKGQQTEQLSQRLKNWSTAKSELLCSPFLIRMKSLVLLYFNPLLNGAFVCVKSAVVVVPCIQLFIQCIFQSPILHIWPCKSKPYSGMSSTKNNQFACIKRRVATDGVLLYNDHFWLLPFLARWRFTKNIILQFYSFSRYETSSEFSTLCYCAQLTLAFYGLSLSNWMDDKWELLYCLRNSFLFASWLWLLYSKLMKQLLLWIFLLDATEWCFSLLAFWGSRDKYLISVLLGQTEQSHSIHMLSIQIDTSLESVQQHQIVLRCKPYERDFLSLYIY